MTNNSESRHGLEKLQMAGARFGVGNAGWFSAGAVVRSVTESRRWRHGGCSAWPAFGPNRWSWIVERLLLKILSSPSVPIAAGGGDLKNSFATRSERWTAAIHYGTEIFLLERRPCSWAAQKENPPERENYGRVWL